MSNESGKHLRLDTQFLFRAWVTSCGIRLYSTRCVAAASSACGSLLALDHWNAPGSNPYRVACSCARALVSLIFSPKSFWNVATNSSGGPCSMMVRTLSVRPVCVVSGGDLERRLKLHLVVRLVVRYLCVDLGMRGRSPSQSLSKTY